MRIVYFLIVIISYLLCVCKWFRSRGSAFKASENNIYGSPLPKKWKVIQAPIVLTSSRPPSLVDIILKEEQKVLQWRRCFRCVSCILLIVIWPISYGDREICHPIRSPMSAIAELLFISVIYNMVINYKKTKELILGNLSKSSPHADMGERMGWQIWRSP